MELQLTLLYIILIWNVVLTEFVKIMQILIFEILDYIKYLEYWASLCSSSKF